MRSFRLALLMAWLAACGALHADTLDGYLALHNTDEAEFGFGPGLKYTYDRHELLRADGRISFLHYDDIDLNMIPLEATGSIRLPVPDGYEAHAGVGVGYYFVEANRGEADDEVGAKLLLGGSVEFSESFDLFAEIYWRWLSPGTDAEFQAVEGTGDSLNLDGPGVDLGVAYRF